MNLITLAATSLPGADALELVRVAAEAGFGGVGLRLNWPPSRADEPPPSILHDRTQLNQLKRQLRETGLVVLDVYSFYLTAAYDFSRCQQQLEIGAELGARLAVVIGHDTNATRAADTLARFCEVAAPLGFTATVEFAPHRHPATLQQAVSLLQQVRRPNVAIMPDPAHLIGSGGDLSQLEAVAPGTFRHSQLCDVAITGAEFVPAVGRTVPTVERKLPGEGSLSLEAWMNALPRGLPLSLECAPAPHGMSGIDWAKAIYASTRSLLDRVRSHHA